MQLPSYLDIGGDNFSKPFLSGFEAASQRHTQDAELNLRRQTAAANLKQAAYEFDVQKQHEAILNQAAQQKMKLDQDEAQRQAILELSQQKELEQAGGDINKIIGIQMKYGPLRSKTGSVSGFPAASASMNKAADIPKTIDTPWGDQAIQYNGRLYMKGQDKAALPPAMSKSATLAASMLHTTIGKLDAKIDKADPVIDKGRVKEWKSTKERMQKQLDALVPEQALKDEEDDDGTGDAPGGSGGDVVATYDPKTKTLKKAGQ